MDFKNTCDAGVKFGSRLSVAGLLGLAIAIGVVVGFYAADQGVRWLPTMVEIFLAISLVSLVTIIIGRIVKKETVKVTERGVRVRWRITICLVLAIIVFAAQLAVYKMREPSMLTDLSAADFNEAFLADCVLYREYDRGLENLLQRLESKTQMFNADAPRVLTRDEEVFLREVWVAMYDYAFELDRIRLFYEDWYRFDPSRAERKFHLRSFMLTYAAELSLYEKSSRLVKLVSTNPNAEKFLNTPGPGDLPGADSFSKFRHELQGIRDKMRVTAGQGYLNWLDKGLNGRTEAEELGAGRLWEKIEIELAMINANSPIELTGMSVKSDLEVLRQNVKRVWFPAQKGVATWMGNTRLRRIGTYLISDEQLEEMDKHLEPGDIILSRKNWYVSNVGLPGFWPHAILYVGNPEKLETYFDTADVRGYVKSVSGRDQSLSEYLARRFPGRSLRYTAGYDQQNYRVIEAISKGVVLNTLKGCCGDYMGVLRPRVDKVVKAQAIVQAFEHLDKPYDYEFDFATDHTLVCTELIWRCYRPTEEKEGINFTLIEMAGRMTLPANEIAKKYSKEKDQENRKLDFVYFLDAREKTQTVILADEQAFSTSWDRPKWGFALE